MSKQVRVDVQALDRAVHRQRVRLKAVLYYLTRLCEQLEDLMQILGVRRGSMPPGINEFKLARRALSFHGTPEFRESAGSNLKRLQKGLDSLIKEAESLDKKIFKPVRERRRR